MRVSTQMLFEQGLNGIRDQQSRLAQVQRQLATGLKVNSPSDDPVAAARIQQLERAVAQQQVFVDNAGRVEQRLASEESALDSASEVIRRVRELTVQAANDTVGDSGRLHIAIELRQRLDQLVMIANSRDGGDEFVFAGSRSTTQPFSTEAGQVQYGGDSQQRELVIGSGTTMRDGDPGDEVFMRVRDGNGTVRATADGGNTGAGVIIAEPGVDPVAFTRDTFTIEFTAADAFEVTDSGGAVLVSGTFESGESIAFAGISVAIQGQPAAGDRFTVEPARFESMFATIDQLAMALEAAPGNPADRTAQRQAMAEALGQLDNAESRLLEVRASVGGRLQSLEDLQSTQLDVQLGLQGLVSEIRDLDLVEAIARLQQNLTTLEASQQSFARIQGNSLFRFI